MDDQMTALGTSLIPANFLNQLLAWRDMLSDAAWGIGDVTNEVYQLAVVAHPGVTRMEVCAMIATVVGAAPRTVRRYAAVAGFFNQAARLQYDVLPFSHYELAMQYGVGRAVSVLETSMDYFRDRGIPPSLNRLYVLMQGGGSSASASPSPTLGVGNGEQPISDMSEIQPTDRPIGDEPGFRIPHPDEAPDPVALRREHARQAVSAAGFQLAEVGNMLAPVPAALEALETYPELAWLKVEIADVALRLRRVVEAIRKLAGEDVPAVYLPDDFGEVSPD